MPEMEQQFEQRLTAGDLSLFDGITSQLEPGDKKSLLAIQNAVRRLLGSYRYLEIGSYLGGSLQPHVVDPRCTAIVSIDKRIDIPADERVDAITYPENTTRHMLSLLERLSPDGARKIRTIDADAADIDPGSLEGPQDLCFIDGEHTDAAVRSDFRFCRSVLAPNGAILFHDANLVFSGIAEILRDLRGDHVPFHAYVLPCTVFVIEFGNCPLHATDGLRDLLADNHEAYLYGMLSMEHYRSVYNSWPVQTLRRIKHFSDRIRRVFG